MEENIVKLESAMVLLVKSVPLVILVGKIQLKQKKHNMKVLGIGNAIIDVICKVDDDFLKKITLRKAL